MQPYFSFSANAAIARRYRLHPISSPFRTDGTGSTDAWADDAWPPHCWSSPRRHPSHDAPTPPWSAQRHVYVHNSRHRLVL